MSNTKIQLKKSGISGNVPADLHYGEPALNYEDGRLYYKAADGSIGYISSTDSFNTINVNSTLIFATSNADILTIKSAYGVNVSATGKIITIGDGETSNLAKASYIHANAAYDYANTFVSGISADNYARDKANGAFDRANAAYEMANSDPSFANGAFTTANSAASFANGAFVTANSGASFANGAFGQANSAASFANGAFTKANNSGVFANAAFDRANAAYAMANSDPSFANGAFDRANASYTAQNTTASFANSAYAHANAAYAKANTGTTALDVNSEIVAFTIAFS
jgi:hypothetical protein